MSVPLAIPTDEGHQKTRPGFLFPVQKSERSPAGSVDESVFRQIAGWVEGEGRDSKCCRAVAHASSDLTVVDGALGCLARTVNILLSWINQD